MTIVFLLQRERGDNVGPWCTLRLWAAHRQVAVVRSGHRPCAGSEGEPPTNPTEVQVRRASTPSQQRYWLGGGDRESCPSVGTWAAACLPYSLCWELRMVLVRPLAILTHTVNSTASRDGRGVEQDGRAVLLTAPSGPFSCLFLPCNKYGPRTQLGRPQLPADLRAKRR